MINVKKNKQINEALAELYRQYTEPLLRGWVEEFGGPRPPRINEFGIIDEERYDTDDGVLFICKETNGWDDDDFSKGILFRSWMQQITRQGFPPNSHIKRHPQMWYNLDRWATLIQRTPCDLNKLAQCKEVYNIGTIAITNINKVKGRRRSEKEYWNLAQTETVGEVIRGEIDIIQPKRIVCCGTCQEFMKHVPNSSGKAFCMPHPGARFNSIMMMEKLESQLSRA